MFGLYTALALLGLSAIDPIGIGIMPVLLVQKHPYRRAAVFLGGSFASLMAMGLLFARGLGQGVLKFEKSHLWFVPAVEAVGGAILLIIAATVSYNQLKAGKISIEPSKKTAKWLQLGDWQLFLMGGLLVAIQSIIDVVFVIAMIRVGQLKLSDFILIAAIATYSVAALILQIAVIVAFRLAPPHQKAKTLAVVRTLLIKYSNQVLIIVSLVLSLILFALALA